MSKITEYASLVKFSHTVFAMPFALIGYTYALISTEAKFQLTILLQILLCMVFARNTAMGFNRLVDYKIDAQNPRTADREIPRGVISPRSATIFVIANALLFITVTATINRLTLYLSPIALLVVMGYSYCKRFTSLAHLVLGLGLAIAPMGAYIAVTGVFSWSVLWLSLAVMTWTAGFDIIYALQDLIFDKSNDLHSIPSRFGAKGALVISCALHIITFIAIITFGINVGGDVWYWVGTTIFTALLLLQHLLVTPTRLKNIGIAFGTTNGIASILFALFVILDFVISFF